MVDKFLYSSNWSPLVHKVSITGVGWVHSQQTWSHSTLLWKQSTRQSWRRCDDGGWLAGAGMPGSHAWMGTAAVIKKMRWWQLTGWCWNAWQPCEDGDCSSHQGDAMMAADWLVLECLAAMQGWWLRQSSRRCDDGGWLAGAGMPGSHAMMVTAAVIKEMQWWRLTGWCWNAWQPCDDGDCGSHQKDAMMAADWLMLECMAAMRGGWLRQSSRRCDDGDWNYGSHWRKG